MAEPRLRLGEQLLAAGLVTDEGLKEALAEQKIEGGYLADRLVELGRVDERALLRFMAEVSGAKYITVDTLAKANLPQDALDKVPARHAELLCVLPLAFEAGDSVLTLAVPELDQGLFEQVRLAAAVAKIQPIVALRAAIRAGIRRFYYSDHYAFATLDHGTAKPVVRPAVRESIIARSSAPKVAPVSADTDLVAARRELERWKAVAELSRVLAREKATKALLHRTLAFAFDRLPADDGVALLWDPKAKSLQPKAVRTRAGEAAEVMVSETLLKVVVEEGGVITTDAAVDARFSMSESIMQSALRSAMGVPIRVGESLAGALVFATRGDKAGVFTDPDLALAAEMGTEVGFALERIQGARKEEAEQSQRDRFARHFPPAIGEQLLGGSLVFAEAGEAYPAVVLCARVIGAEATGAAPPSVLFAALTAHAEQMADVTFAHAGMVLDNAGSRTLAVFGIPRSRGDEAWRAVRAAQEMLDRVQFMNELRIAEGKPSLELAIGVAGGSLALGQVGERHRAQFGALGSPLDRAALLAGAAEHGDLVADEALADQLEARVGAGTTGPVSGSRFLRRAGS
jgi:class 3 adenylate cyclase